MKKLALVMLFCLIGCEPRGSREGRPITVTIVGGDSYYCAQAVPGLAMDCIRSSGFARIDVLLFGASTVELGGLNGQSKGQSEGR